ncbi:hypothetical protein [Streptomyces sp. SID13031]|uniref:hypothetical protein n=1 Tax=Streptomyces sp. SID13031 TaxID=2706046 RepID=UPI0013C95176|nr:hypothetical protein [Streptomyces sp. SID13031]NEA34381.1 hypothetical protein [Streptomyces sp. SID13031]
MKLIGWGVLVILLDFHYQGVDLIVDLAGWIMLYVGLRRIWRLDNAFRVATGFAFVGAVASIPELLPLFGGPAFVGGEARLALLIFVGGAVIILTCTGLMRVADQAGDRSLESRARWLRGTEAVSVVVSLLIGPRQAIVMGGGDPVGGVVGLLAFLSLGLAFVAVVWFVLLMFSQSVVNPTTVRSQAIT